MSLPVINNFGLSNTATSSIYRNLTKIAADTYPTSDSQSSVPHFWQPQNKLENYINNADTELRIVVSTGATSFADRQVVAISWQTSVTDYVIQTQCGPSGCYTGSTGATQLYYLDLGETITDTLGVVDTSFRQFFSLDRFYDSAESGLTNGGVIERSKTQRVRIELAPFTQLALVLDGEVFAVFYNRWDSLYDLVVPDNLGNLPLAVNRDFWFFNFRYFQATSPTVLQNTAWIYLARQIPGSPFVFN